MTDTHVPLDTLSTIRGHLDGARSVVEESAASAPGAVDGGDMTPILARMLARLTANAATLSEGLAAVSTQVGATSADFWSVDSDISSSFGGGRPHVD